MAFLQTDAISMRFGGIDALDAVSVSAEPGLVTGLIGPNGAGKTTLFNIITGLQPPTAGRVFLDGRDVTDMSVYRRARLGIGRTFQRLEIFGSLSVRDNIRVTLEVRRRWSRQRIDINKEAAAILERVGLADLAKVPADTLPTGLARLVELGRALATRPRLLLLDEPGSGLDATETEAFGKLLADLANDGLAVLLVEHDMDLVMKACSQLSVLDYGELIASGTPEEIRANQRVQDAYLGSEDLVEDAAVDPSTPPGLAGAGTGAGTGAGGLP
ncbi:MAG TPA: ABC transporter ATP-binding protein [Acidimicrobiales bacterium]|nr:ABC transporter ATP-binding protein [Acidimicrobiales bacterium]